MGKTIKHSALLHFGADPVTQNPPGWFKHDNGRATIEAGIKETKQVFYLHKIKVRSEPAIYLQEVFVIFAANFILPINVALAPVDVSALAATPSWRPPPNETLGGHAFLWAIALNSFGTLCLVGGSLYSIVRRQRVRTNAWIAAGALVVALATGMSRAGGYSLVYTGELVGIAMMFAGFRLVGAEPSRSRPTAHKRPRNTSPGPDDRRSRRGSPSCRVIAHERLRLADARLSGSARTRQKPSRASPMPSLPASPPASSRKPSATNDSPRHSRQSTAPDQCRWAGRARSCPHEPSKEAATLPADTRHRVGERGVMGSLDDPGSRFDFLHTSSL